MAEGYFLKARQIKDSWIAHAPPVIRETWDYLLMEANHKDKKYNGFIIKRGQLFRSYEQIREALHWTVGYRKETYSENQMKHAMNLLRREGMITLTKQPRGNLIEVLNYSKYQDPTFYVSTSESTDESTINQPSINQASLSINKNDNNDKNEKMKETFSKENDTPPKKEIAKAPFGKEDLDEVANFILSETGLPMVSGQQARRYLYNWLRALAKQYPENKAVPMSKKVIQLAINLQDNWHSSKVNDPKHLFYNWQEIIMKAKNVSGKRQSNITII